MERRSGLFRPGAGSTASKDRRLRPWRAAYDFRLWTRTVLSPDDDRRFERWALKNEDAYTALVRRYGENDDARARTDLLNSIQNMLWEGETHSFDSAFEDWDEGKEP